MATSPSETPPSPPNDDGRSSSPPESSPPSPPASSPPPTTPSSSPPSPSPPTHSPPPSPLAEAPTTDSSPAPPDSQSAPTQSTPHASPPPLQPTPAPPLPKTLPLPSTILPPPSELQNPNSPPSPVFLPPPAIPSEGTPAPAKQSTTSSSSSQSAPSNPSDSGHSPSSSANNNAIIAGTVAAGTIFLLIAIICLMCSRKKKKQPQRYFMSPAHPPQVISGDQQYYHSSAEWHNSPQGMVVQIPPQPQGISGPGSWGALPLQPGSNFSSEHSSSFFGQHLPPASPLPNMGGLNQMQFSYEELAAATNGFSQANLLGQGGFGYVYKGVLNNGKVVAVKSLKTGSGQGEREFQAEVEIISRVHHRHLVSLVGYCIANRQKMLVYEFVRNKTLEFHLHGNGQPVMDWATRLKIAIGSAKGLAYLHEDCHPRIIHRDIKTANILLDENFEAMVADFGLAKLTNDNNTHVSTRVMGTFGYLAPEYASSGKLTEKSDVFSFGVMLLEFITGRKPVDLNNYEEDSLVDWARPLLTKALEDGNYAPLADPRLEGNYNVNEMACMVACAAASILHSAKRRPRMSQIMHVLEGNSSLDSLNEIPKATPSSTVSTNDSRLYDTVAYNADMVKFKKMVMTSQEFTSSEYGAGTGEYTHDSSSSSSDSKERP